MEVCGGRLTKLGSDTAETEYAESVGSDVSTLITWYINGKEAKLLLSDSQHRIIIDLLQT